MTDGAPWKHHYIPVFYSRQWAGADGLLVRFDRPHKEVVDRRVSPARVGWKENLYRMRGRDGANDQVLEQAYFSRVDDVAARILAKMLANPPARLQQIEVNDWGHFLLSLLHRTPTFMQETKKYGIEMWRQVLDDAAEGRSVLPASWEPSKIKDYRAAATDADGEASVMRALPMLIANTRMIAHLQGLHWAYYDAPLSGPDLLLSDNPVLMTNGIDVPGGHLAMPLSPRRFIVLARERETIEVLNRASPRQLVKGVNRHTVRSANEFVVAADLAQAPFVRKHFGAEPAQSLVGRSRSRNQPAPLDE